MLCCLECGLTLLYKGCSSKPCKPKTAKGLSMAEGGRLASAKALQRKAGFKSSGKSGFGQEPAGISPLHKRA
jgi:hypothetical protein